MTEAAFTVLGASGFIGSHLVRSLEKAGIVYSAPGRDEELAGRNLGQIIYCIGVTADFRSRPFDTVRAHVCRLLEVLERTEFDSFLYLSTTRLYKGAPSTEEEVDLRVNPLVPDDLYNASKIAGESVCLSCNRPNVRIARLSNVYGEDFASTNFLSSVVQDAVSDGHVILRTTMDSEKDYVSVDDVVGVLPKIARSGKYRVYNVASGTNTTNRELMANIQGETGCTVEVAEDAVTSTFLPISIDRVREEFDFSPVPVLDSLGKLVTRYRREVAGS